MSRFNTRSIILFILLFIATAANARSFAVKGIAIDSDGEPEIYATVRIFQQNDSVKPVSMGVTGNDGAFSCTLKNAGAYRLILVSVGKSPSVRDFEVTAANPVATLDTIVTHIDDNILGEVVVEAARPLVSVEIDRISYDVTSDTESKTSMLDETLNKVPLVSVDPDGTIKVNGSTSFKIYKNGRPNNSYSNNAKEIFKALPASMIQKIEVITDPGAREDAEGTTAILNIITVKNVITKGAMGNVGLGYNSRTDAPMPSLWMSAQYDKLSLSIYGGGSITTRGTSSKSRSESETKYLQTGNSLLSESESDRKSVMGYWGLESSLDLDKYNLFTFEFGGFLSSGNSISNSSTTMLDAEGNKLYSYRTIGKTHPQRWTDLNGSFNYQRSTDREGEAIILSYRISGTLNKSISETDYTDTENVPMQYTGIHADNREDGLEHTVQLDWTRPINKANSFDIGGKFIYRDNHSNTTREYVGLNTDYSDFKHITQISALFADYRLNLGKFGARAGVRYEYSHLSAKFLDGSADPFSANLNDWVPNASVMYNINQRNSLKLSFGSRIQRPGIYYLNPAVNTSPNETSEGNPDLSSVRQNSLGLNYNLMGAKVSVSLNSDFNFADNEIISVAHAVGDHTYSGYANAGRRRSVSIGGYISWRPTAKTSLMINARANYTYVKNPYSGEKSSGWGQMIFGNLSQRLPWKMHISVFGSYWVSAPSLYSRMDAYGLSNINWGLNLRRSFLKEDRLSVGMSISNPIRTHNPGYISKSWNNGMTSRSRSYQYRMTTFGISVSYRFGSLNTSVKKVKKSISNDDVVGGSSVGGNSSSESESGAGGTN